MSRVSENSSVSSINYALGKSKGKVEELQLKGSTLKRLTKPSDDPLGNVELMAVRSQKVDAEQYLRNLNFAKTQLSYTENILEEMTDILVTAKELAIGQASSIYSPDVRLAVSKEIHQIRNQVLGLANKRIGNRYLFSGQKVLTRPFDESGHYNGDQNKINIEINKDLFIPINLSGRDLFFCDEKKSIESEQLNLSPTSDDLQRTPAAESGEVPMSIFDELFALENALLNDNPKIIQGLLENLDSSIERVVTFRTEIGALTNTIANTETNIEKSNLVNEAHKSRIEDADVSVIMGDLQKEQAILKATYKASSNLMNTSLMDFLR